eukprot:203367-Rhodomonas_salina.8
MVVQDSYARSGTDRAYCRARFLRDHPKTGPLLNEPSTAQGQGTWRHFTRSFVILVNFATVAQVIGPRTCKA